MNNIFGISGKPSLLRKFEIMSTILSLCFFFFSDKIYFFHRKWLGLTLEKKLIKFLMNMAKLQERTFWNHFFIFLGKFKIMDFHYKKITFQQKNAQFAHNSFSCDFDPVSLET